MTKISRPKRVYTLQFVECTSRVSAFMRYWLRANYEIVDAEPLDDQGEPIPMVNVYKKVFV